MLNKLLFPHSDARTFQEQMIKDVHEAIKNKKNIIIHAPTGLGKTAATIPVCLSHALEKKLTVFFLTSRHTQHKIAVETLKRIKEKHGVDFTGVDVLGKKWMCNQSVERLTSSDFSDYCKTLREEGNCEFYNNTKEKSKITEISKEIISELKNDIHHSEYVLDICKKERVCAYEILLLLAKKSDVIVADYYYIFNPAIRNLFFIKTGKKLQEAILIVDEAHNLGERIRNLMTSKLSSITLRRAIREAKKYGFSEAIGTLASIQDVLNHFSANLEREEKKIGRDEFAKEIEKIGGYEEVIAQLEFCGVSVREKQKQSYIGNIVNFLSVWCGPDNGFSRILSAKKDTQGLREPYTVLSYRCLDPSVIASDVFKESYASILMSGTLTPTGMYRDLLGIPRSEERVYESPFPKKNRLTLIVPTVTTKFSLRNDEQYRNIAEICSTITNLISGNSLVFFPSYELRDRIYKHFEKKCNKTIFLEQSLLGKKDKAELLEKYKKYHRTGAVLLCAAAGSFGEGIDLPGIVKCVIVVGLPLQKPNLETTSLIEYYDKKFGNGWDYGYVMPAITKTMQNAGRSIRSEKDKAVIVFLDERYAWRNYLKCFPKDWEIEITKDFSTKIVEFFNNCQ